MDNKQIAKQFFENLFVDNDKAYEVLSDDVRVNWPGFGMDDIVGKENLYNFLSNDGPEKVLKLQINNVIGEGDVVIADGNILTERHGKQETSHFADVYTVRDGKITSLVSYMVFGKENEGDTETE
ncbi:nuclear transport factor 2 family protein [Kaistella faecalis]|uniref:nuclear transport factor 2 family protein n=1 Tax=Kaistella faecalis TaxID=2852098 RepID=UPI001A24CF80|nr:nuclear transport factor 2 family protein [Chryseobacterium faecale]MBH1959499.1 nuclear transport factor 2 family protein [Flavobacteriia bacterium]MBH2023481.1 nuclear transport factor 2 family protein [Flavobacteriales bacterium]UFK97632.1 nuclear transport factor 2 family protein [Chryseobacterium faecale]